MELLTIDAVIVLVFHRSVQLRQRLCVLRWETLRNRVRCGENIDTGRETHIELFFKSGYGDVVEASEDLHQRIVITVLEAVLRVCEFKKKKEQDIRIFFF